MLVWELVGAAVGAGFASGREIAVFFAQYGIWSYAGLAMTGAMLLLAGEPVPAAWQGRWPEKLWKLMLSVLLIATGGAMLAGSGEICAQVLPVKRSNEIGMTVTLLISWLLAMKTKTGLAWVSRSLVVVLTILLFLAFRLQPLQAAVIANAEGFSALLSGSSYGGFNAALQWSVLSAAAMNGRHKRCALQWATLIIMLLLLLGTFLIGRNSALIEEPMPFLMMMKQFGIVGYMFFVLCLYLAVLSTLTACIRALSGRFCPILAILMVSAGGFAEAVGSLYPLLGGACCIMLLLAKIMNSFTSSFLSQKDML